MNILMFHQHFNTPEGGGAIRSYYLATALAQHGHQVIMITSCTLPQGSVQNIEGVTVVYLPVPYNNRFSFYARSFSFIRFVVGAIRAASKYRNYDVCYGISAPLTVGLCTRWMKFRYGMPYFFEVGDLWPDAPIQLGFVRSWMFKRILFGLEKAVYRKAKAIVALSPMIQSAISLKVADKRIHLVPNMADCEFYQPEAKKELLEEKFQTKGKMVVSYIGTFGVANGLHYLLDCAFASQSAGLPVQFVLCGDGAMVDELKSRTVELRLSNVTFTGFVNREGVKEVMNVTDAIFICYKHVPILETGCPNKYFDGLASGKMILVNFGGWIRKEIEAYGCGQFVSPTEPTDFVEKISTLIQSPALQEPMRRAARELGESRYSRKLLSESFAKLF